MAEMGAELPAEFVAKLHGLDADDVWRFTPADGSGREFAVMRTEMLAMLIKLAGFTTIDSLRSEQDDDNDDEIFRTPCDYCIGKRREWTPSCEFNK